MKLSGKIVILTGASQGIGKAAAYKFAQAGCKVALVARSAKMLTEIVKDIGENHALAIPADVSQKEDCKKIVEKTIEHYGKVDVLINNAGVGLYQPMESVLLSDINTVMNVNFIGVIQLSQAVIPKMRTHGGGLIINVASIIGKRGFPNMGIYCASKAALERMTESWRVEQEKDNIRFSMCYPGITQTNFQKNTLGIPPTDQFNQLAGVSAERVAWQIVQTARRESRDAYVTLFDKMFILGTKHVPHLFDMIFRRYS
ncbi:MAG: hypothetical protein B6242_00035 [Anaerolineaceae bacterium 4572_78]|nr:MAG: hypothetical protein B6242_00035 [Anaerolineaceae bacterium 4572_78]